ncbi:HTH-type transcriptional regulator / antitoxin HigA [Chitinophaga sp. CF118]|uniref:helix-turn-helix domain-containing protein n=1 Tax=Chitinophaga sp. CF118 TaxID=1884367 RepID=UPI0008E15EB0|nr:helix-turn-helix domain-containing protein [Chitinophaga sp. CF118]SFD99885.1 HTH-type transcriptional regulator / antitoxin HigA [Chitinophaga sp. CF118]
MDTLQFKVIKTEKQYKQYCNQLETLLALKKKNKYNQDVIELLTVLIEKWDAEHSTFTDADPIELLRYLMNENNLKSVDLAKLLEISTSLVSDILNYRRSLSKDIIRKLSERFKLSQEAFNRPYKLISSAKPQEVSVMKITKKVAIEK